jgi:predicted transglutaminase-like cysteine proteinase
MGAINSKPASGAPSPMVNTPPGEVPVQAPHGVTGPSVKTNLPNLASISQNGKKNAKKFLAFFHLSAGKNKPSPSRFSNDMIRYEPQLQTAPAEPSPEELIPEVETFVKSSLEKNSTDTKIDWGAQAEQHKDLAHKFESLRKDLERIDKKVNDEINQMRIKMVYQRIQDWKKPDSTARALTKEQHDTILKETTTTQERFFPKRKGARELTDAAGMVYKIAVEKQQAANEEAAIRNTIDSFKDRVSKEFEPAREKNIRNICLKHLVADIEHNGPGTPMYKIVAAISPAAIKQFDEYESNDKVEELTQKTIAGCNSADIVDAFVGDMASGASYSDGYASMVAELRADLVAIDGKVVNDIRGLCATAYNDLWKANQPDANALTGAQPENIKDRTRRSLNEFLPWSGSGKTLKIDRKKLREDLKEQKKKENATAATQTAIDRFKNGVTARVESGRKSEIAAACVGHLSKEPQFHPPGSPLYKLVQQISPEAIKQFDENKPQDRVVSTIRRSTINTQYFDAKYYATQLFGNDEKLEPLRKFMEGASLSEIALEQIPSSESKKE